jgi:hypothetical protein
MDKLCANRIKRSGPGRNVLMLHRPGFPVELCGATELHAAFREESRTSFLPASAALQEIRDRMRNTSRVTKFGNHRA